MKILFIANARIPTEKAHGLQIMKMSEAFLLQGSDVTLLLPRRRNYIKDSPQTYYSLKKVPNIVYVRNYVGFLESHFHKTYFLFQKILFGISAFFYALRSDANVIFSREMTVCFFLSILGRKAVFEDHEPKKKLSFLYRFFVRKIWKKIVVPPALADLYRAWNVPANSYIIAPNGVDLSEFKDLVSDREEWKKYDINPSHKIVLYVGHFYAWKGIYTLIDAAAFMPDIQVVLIGGLENDRVKVSKYISERAIKNVYSLAFMNHSNVLRRMVSADVLVLPNTAKEERSNKYTTPIKLFEYMASGVPIVASDLPSFHSFLHSGTNASLCKPDSPQDLAKSVMDMCADQKLSHNIALQAKKDVAKYTWDSRARLILGFMI